jgi:hypothetical protein
MDLLFKTSPPSSGNTLIKHTNFQEHAPIVNYNTDWLTLRPFIKRAVRTYILPWIGEELYNDIATKYQEDATLTDAQAETLELLQDAVANYAVVLAMPVLNVALTNMGTQQSSDREGTSNPPSQWSYNNAYWETLQQADSSLDQLLKQLTFQVELSNSYYDLWTSSNAYGYGKSYFFYSNDELSNHLNYNDSLRAYKAVIKFVKTSETRYLRPVLGKEMFDELDTQRQTNALTVENAALLTYVQRAAAQWGLYEAIPYLSIVQDGDGFKVVSRTDNMNSRRGMNTDAHQRAIESLRQAAENNGRTYLADLQQFLYENADDYPTFKNSSTYENYETGVTTYESPDQKGAVFL